MKKHLQYFILLILALLPIELMANEGLSGPPTSNGSSSIAPTVYPETYGALGNGGVYFDGIVTSPTVATSKATSTTVTAPAVTTQTANDLVLSVFSTAAAWSSAPAIGTTRENVAFVSGGYGIFGSDQLAVSPGATTPISGTVGSSSVWQTATIALAPSGGGPVTFVAGNTFQNNSVTQIVLTKPTGTASGDYLVACMVYFDQIPFFFAPTGWKTITSISNATTTVAANNLICYGKTAGGSEPANYLFQSHAPSTAGAAAFILDYTGTSGVDPSTVSISSATANFPSTASGDPICVAPSTGGETCGSISAYNSSSSVNLNFSTPLATNALQFGYGSNDSTAFSNMLTTAPCSTVGCAVQLQSHKYVLTSSLTLPPNIPITINGNGAGVANTANTYINGNTIVNANKGSWLQFLTTSLATPAITIGGTLHVTSSAAFDKISNLTMYGGAGTNFDGGGADAIDVLNWQGALLSNIMVFNFLGYGIYVDGMAAANFRDYSENISLDHVFASFNGLGGWKVGSTTAVNNIENTGCNFCIIEANGGPGILLAGANIQGLSIYNSTLQWDNIFATNAEIFVTGKIVGGVVEATYVESDNALGSNSNGVFNQAAVGTLGLKFKNNYYTPSSAYTPTTFTTSTLPSCATNNNITNHNTATVTDSTACTIGTTYTSGGSTQCDVTCSGGNWIETGAASY